LVKSVKNTKKNQQGKKGLYVFRWIVRKTIHWIVFWWTVRSPNRH